MIKDPKFIKWKSAIDYLNSNLKSFADDSQYSAYVALRDFWNTDNYNPEKCKKLIKTIKDSETLIANNEVLKYIAAFRQGCSKFYVTNSEADYKQFQQQLATVFSEQNQTSTQNSDSPPPSPVNSSINIDAVVTKWIEAIKYIIQNKVSLTAKQTNSIKELLSYWKTKTFNSTVCEQLIKDVKSDAVLITDNRLSRSITTFLNTCTKFYVKGGSAEFQKFKVVLQKSSLLESLIKEFASIQNTPERRPRAESISTPAPPRSQRQNSNAKPQVVAVNFYNTNKGEILSRAKNYLYPYTKYLTAEIVFDSNPKPGIYDIIVRIITPSGQIMSGSDSPSGFTFADEVSVENNVMIISGYGSVSGNTYSERGEYKYEVWLNNQLLVGEKFLVKNRPQIKVTGVSFVHVDRNNKPLEQPKSYFNIDTQFLRPVLKVESNSGDRSELYELEIKIYTPSSKLLRNNGSSANYSMRESIVLGNIKHDLNPFGQIDGKMFSERGDYSYEVWSPAGKLHEGKFTVRVPHKVPKGALSKKIHKVFQDIDDEGDSYDGILMTVLGLVWLLLVVLAFIEDGFWIGIWAAIKHGFFAACTFGLLSMAGGVFKWIFYNALTFFTTLLIACGIGGYFLFGDLVMNNTSSSESHTEDMVDAEPPSEVYYVIARSLNIRAAASASSQVVGQATNGGVVQVCEIWVYNG